MGFNCLQVESVEVDSADVNLVAVWNSPDKKQLPTIQLTTCFVDDNPSFLDPRAVLKKVTYLPKPT